MGIIKKYLTQPCETKVWVHYIVLILELTSWILLIMVIIYMKNVEPQECEIMYQTLVMNLT